MEGSRCGFLHLRLRTRVHVHGPTVAWVASEPDALTTRPLFYPHRPPHSRAALSCRLPTLPLALPLPSPCSFLLGLPPSCTPALLLASTFSALPPPFPLASLSPALSPQLFTYVSHLMFRFLGWVFHTHKLVHWLRGFSVAGILCGGSCSTICFYPQESRIIHT